MRFPDVAVFASLHPLSALGPARKSRWRGWLRAGVGPKASLSHTLRNLKTGALFLPASGQEPTLPPGQMVSSRGQCAQLTASGHREGLP